MKVIKLFNSKELIQEINIGKLCICLVRCDSHLRIESDYDQGLKDVLSYPTKHTRESFMQTFKGKTRKEAQDILNKEYSKA